MNYKLFNSPLIEGAQKFLCYWMALGYFLFPLAIYLNPSKGGTSNIFYLGILLPWVLLFLMGKVNLLHKNTIYVVAISLFLYLWINSLWSENNSLTDVIYYLKWFVYVLCLLTAPTMIVVRFPHFFETLLYFIFAVSILSALFIIFSHVNKFGVNFLFSRMSGWGYVYNPISLGLHHGVAVIIGIFLIDKHREKAIILGILCLAPLSALIMSHSRGPMLALLISVFLAFFTLHRSKVVIFTCVLLSGVAMGGIIYIGWDSLMQRGFSGRPEIWEQVWELVKHSIIWGEGFSQQSTRIVFQGTEMTHSHNVVLELLRYGGIVAIILFICHLVTLFRFQLKLGDTLSGYYMLLFCFTIIVMCSSGWYLLNRPNYFWLGYWYPLGFLAAKQFTCQYKVLQG